MLLVPTALELRRLEDQGGFDSSLVELYLCGFGPVASAARSAALIAQKNPARVVLIGIAGSYDPERLPVGSASSFDAVAIEGIGVGEGERALAPPALGFPQWPGGAGVATVHDRLELARAPASKVRSPLLLTTCCASDSPAHAALRRRKFPDAAAEDMEGFGVALACELQGVPCTIVRGISNVVGDRDPAHWRIPAALAAARTLVLELLQRGIGT